MEIRCWASALVCFMMVGCGTIPADHPRSSEVSLDLKEPEARAPDAQPFPLPYAEVEAEAGRTTGTYSEASTTLHSPGAEASGRRYVSLPPGARLVLVAPVAADSLVVRFSYPDGSGGEGQEGELLVSSNSGLPVPLKITSRYSWEYGKPRWGTDDVWSGDPGLGSPRHFWDEANLRTEPMRAGTEVTLTNPAGARETILVDLVDFEQVGPAVPPPEGSLVFSVSPQEAQGKVDLTERFQKAVDGARGRVLYVPEGTYRIDTVYLGAVNVQGAGLWRTRFVGPLSQFRFQGKTVRVADLAIFGETNTRNDNSDEGNGLAGNPGPDSLVERVWIEHKKCAYWVGNWGSQNPVTGLTLAECRFRDTMADGVNLCSGTNHTLVRDCLVRNTGDDSLAAWSPKNGGAAGGNNTFLHNLVQSPWVASGIALYGGGPFVVEGNLVKDTVTTGSGIYVSASFAAWPFAGTVMVQGNWLIRAGAHESDPGFSTGAIRILAGDASMAGATYRFTDNTVVAPLESAVSIQGPRNAGTLVFDGLTVTDLGPDALVVDVKRNASGRGEFQRVTGDDPQHNRWINDAAGDFTLVP